MKSYDEIREIKWSYFIVDILAEFDGNNFYIAVEWRRNDQQCIVIVGRRGVCKIHLNPA